MAKVASITAQIHQAGLTPTGLKDLLLAVDTEASASTSARITTILNGLCNLPLTDGRNLLTETLKADKENKALKVRVSECRQVYGAVKLFDGFRAMVESKSMGWSAAVSAARTKLASAKLKADGSQVVSAEAKAAKQDHAFKAEVLAGLAEDTDAAKVAEILQSMPALKIKAKAEAHALRIGKAEGESYCIALAEALMGLTWEVEQMEEGRPEVK